MFEGATGALVENFPPGAVRDEILMLVRTGIPFARQQCGKRPEFLHNYLVSLIPKLDTPTFENLLHELRLSAQRRDAGDDSEPIERVSKSMECVIYHHPKKGRCEIPFSTLRNKLTDAKNKQFTATPNP